MLASSGFAVSVSVSVSRSSTESLERQLAMAHEVNGDCPGRSPGRCRRHPHFCSCPLMRFRLQVIVVKVKAVETRAFGDGGFRMAATWLQARIGSLRARLRREQMDDSASSRASESSSAVNRVFESYKTGDSQASESVVPAAQGAELEATRVVGVRARAPEDLDATQLIASPAPEKAVAPQLVASPGMDQSMRGTDGNTRNTLLSLSLSAEGRSEPGSPGQPSVLSAVLICVGGALEGEVFKVGWGKCELGREGKDLILPDPTRRISRHQATLSSEVGELTLKANPKIRARNPTIVNGKSIDETDLSDGDEILMGDCRFIIRLV